jgi:hypothetical protein
LQKTMSNADAAISFIRTFIPSSALTWVNPKRVSADWKAKIFQHDPSGLQFAIYSGTTIRILLEHEVPGVTGTKCQSPRPKTSAIENSTSVFKSTPGFYYKVEDHHSLELLVRGYLNAPSSLQDLRDLNLDFERKVVAARADSAEKRRARLQNADRIARKILVQTTAFARNPDVVAEVLFRASGRCEICLRIAPFTKISDGEPYLEVHHRVHLANGGEDSVENTIAACPNCHRKAHYG